MIESYAQAPEVHMNAKLLPSHVAQHSFLIHVWMLKKRKKKKMLYKQQQLYHKKKFIQLKKKQHTHTNKQRNKEVI
jgi:hypothetical protein